MLKGSECNQKTIRKILYFYEIRFELIGNEGAKNWEFCPKTVFFHPKNKITFKFQQRALDRDNRY